MRSISSAFWLKMQEDGVQVAELIELHTRNRSFYWTTANDTIVSSGRDYEPFPGGTPGGMSEASDMSTDAIDFMIANTGSIMKDLMAGGDFAMSSLQVHRIFVDTPDLDRMTIYTGKIGDYSYNRQTITGQARGPVGNMAQQWPYYTYQDECVWRFGGAGCGFNTASVTLTVGTANIVPSSSTQINILLAGTFLTGSFANGYFDFGRFTVTGGVNSGEVRTIRVHTGNLLQLSHALSINSQANLSATIYPGCRKRLIIDCVSKYNNSSAFLGFPEIPVQEQAF